MRGKKGIEETRIGFNRDNIIYQHIQHQNYRREKNPKEGKNEMKIN